MKLDLMTNIKINKINDHYYTVTATTKKFGKNQVMYEGISEDDCNEYIEREGCLRFHDPKLKHTSWAVQRKNGKYYLMYFIDYNLISRKRKSKKDIEEFISERFS